MIESVTGTHTDWVVGIARIVLGIIFFGHGAQKMLGWYGGSGLATSMRTFTEHLHLPATLAFLVIAGEFVSGIGLIVGLFSRVAALVIVLTMVGAIATVHFRFGLFLNWFGDQEGHGIEYHLLAIALALVVVVKGAGAFSLDYLVHEQCPGIGTVRSGTRPVTVVDQGDREHPPCGISNAKSACGKQSFAPGDGQFRRNSSWLKRRDLTRLQNVPSKVIRNPSPL